MIVIAVSIVIGGVEKGSQRPEGRVGGSQLKITTITMGFEAHGEDLALPKSIESGNLNVN